MVKAEIKEEVARLGLQLSIEHMFLMKQLKQLNENIVKGEKNPRYQSQIRTILKRLKGNKKLYERIVRIYAGVK